MKIRCVTLYDITQTGINHRRAKLDRTEDMGIKGSQQSNFETILQCIGIRAQPEDITSPKKEHKKLTKIFGTNYKNNGLVPQWTFTFNVLQNGVFQIGENELEGLYNDCESVPMIKGLEEWQTLSGTLNTSNEYKNIHFEIINEENTL
jgi:CRISPR/Cas system-associated endoribonuclease Cas2